MPQVIQVAIDKLAEIGTSYGLHIVGGVLILVVGLIATRWSVRLAVAAAERSDLLDVTLERYLVKLVRFVVLSITIVAMLSAFGVETTSIIAVLGAAGIAVGLALQSTLSNVASGMVLLFLRPFRVGDAVELAGSGGVVKEVGLFATELQTWDGLFLLVANAQVWGSKIKNISRNGQRRIELSFRVGYGEDLDEAIRLAQEVLADDDRVLTDPEPLVHVGDIDESAVGLLVWPWTKMEDWFATKLDLNKRIKERFDQAGIRTPYPQRTVHVVGDVPRQAA